MERQVAPADPNPVDQVAEGRRRVVVENISPQVDGGRFPVKRVTGDTVTVQADIFTDGHDRITALLLYRRNDEYQWHKTPMRFIENDCWEGSFEVDALGPWHYTIEAWVDHFLTWRSDFEKKYQAGEYLELDRRIGAAMIEETALRAGHEDAARLREFARLLVEAEDAGRSRILAGDEELAELMAFHYDPELATISEPELSVTVESPKARFSAWYELFPRSTNEQEKVHGTFRDCEKLLPEIAAMGFDILYLPPIHPIGLTNRKGANNAVIAREGEPGSPWAIGSPEGGHRSVHPELGTLEDFDRLVARASDHGLQVAMDIAFQCSPDHPYVRQHPGWFRWRPDGTVQYAENPPKKYQDIIPFDFESAEWRKLWDELKGVFLFWIERGITIFRVDNPHTKPFGFWEWTISEIRKEHPETIFLSEAFTRPKVMYRLAKAGFNQSYTYFTWRNTKWELEQYLRELATPPVRDFFRPNFWPNTPDILPEFLQYGGKPAFFIRLALAATLSASYGIYGPPFELFVNEALPGREEYLDSEKYQLHRWDWDDPNHLRDLITRLNSIRRENPALQQNWNLHFCETDNDNLICFLKSTEDRSNLMLVMISLDPFNRQEGRVRVPLETIGTTPGHPFLVEDLLGDENNIWHDAWNPVDLDPRALPVRICRLRTRLRREEDFDYFM